VKVIDCVVMVPVCAFDTVTWVKLSIEATTAPAATLVPVTAMPSVISAVDAMPVRVNAPLTPDAVCVTTMPMQCAPCMTSAFQVDGNC
jgi:hypothetical protein